VWACGPCDCKPTHTHLQIAGPPDRQCPETSIMRSALQQQCSHTARACTTQLQFQACASLVSGPSFQACVPLRGISTAPPQHSTETAPPKTHPTSSLPNFPALHSTPGQPRPGMQSAAYILLTQLATDIHKTNLQDGSQSTGLPYRTSTQQRIRCMTSSHAVQHGCLLQLPSIDDPIRHRHLHNCWQRQPQASCPLP
jgi:hypothetical protein